MTEESSTSDLVEIITGLFEAADRGDWDAVLAPYAPDAILESDYARTLVGSDSVEARAAAERLAQERA